MPPVGHDTAMGMHLPTGNTRLGMWQGREEEGDILWDKDRVSLCIILGEDTGTCYWLRSEG